MIRILIADDHEIVRSGLRALLGSHAGWEIVAEAADGHAAVEAAEATSPDVAVLDCAMPRMNGIDAARRIHQHVPKTEVCLFTYFEDESIIAEALRAGVRGYILKSDPESELLAAVEALSQHHPYFSWVVSASLLDHFVKHIGKAPKMELLTPREREVVQLVAEGQSNKEVSRKLNVSLKTVETHRGAAMRKAGLSSTADLVRYAVRNHLVEP
jgi:DNA-binding NarL/FixJ family response regulator